jgi:hemerythrin
MQEIQWSERLSVGVPMMDAQHKRLIELINTMHGQSDAGTLFDVIMLMFNYASEHFAAEEQLMRAGAYPDLERQIREHKAFLAKTTDFAGRDFSEPEARAQVTAYLCTWLTHHILDVDMQYKGRLGQP